MWISFFLIFQTYYNRAQESQFLSIFFQSVTIEFYKWRCAVYCYKKKITLLDEEYGCIVYSMLENNNQSVFFLIYPPVSLSIISWRIVPHFLIKSHDVSCFYFLNLLPCFYIHMYVNPSQLLTHTSVVPKKKE